MQKVACKLTAGKWSVDSAADPKTELVELDVYAPLNSPGGYCRMVVYTPAAQSPGLLEQAAGAAASALGLGGGAGGGSGFALNVRGQAVQPDDAVKVELTAGDVADTVMTARVRTLRSSLGVLEIAGGTGLARLAATRLNQVYENRTLGQIVRDLAGQAGMQAGDIEDGRRYPYVVVHESKTVFRAIVELARREGLDVYCDAEDRLVVKGFEDSAEGHTFQYARDILDLSLGHLRPAAEHVVVHGESPASAQGTDSWHWLARDWSSFRGESGRENRLFAVQDGAIRTKDAAGTYASAWLGAVRDAATAGRLKILGHPKVRAGQAVAIAGAPRPELNGTFKVIAVRHRFDKRGGYATWIDFTGQGGSAAAGGLLGAAAGALGL